MTFLTDLWIVLPLCGAIALHTAAALADLVIRNGYLSRFLNTGLTSINILLHLFLILVMMERRLLLEEAVLVFVISIFFHTLLYYIRYTVAAAKAKKTADREANNL